MSESEKLSKFLRGLAEFFSEESMTGTSVLLQMAAKELETLTARVAELENVTRQ